MAGAKDDDTEPDAGEVAAYVATMAQELKRLADGNDLRPLGYLLDLVRLEAEQTARDLSQSRGFVGERS